MEVVRDQIKVNDLRVNFVDVGTTQLAYVEKGRGEPVVFVHGAVSDFRAWLEQLDPVSHRFRAIAYSRRSHWPNVDETVSDPYLRISHARDLVQLLEVLGLEGVHLVGHSFGGAVALLAALQRPDLVSSLVLGEPSPFLTLFDLTDVDLVLKQKSGFDEARLLIRAGRQEAAVRQFLSVTVGADVLDQLPSASRTMVLDNAITLGPMLEHYFESFDSGPSEFGTITKPTLLVSGEFSPHIARLHNEKLCLSMPKARESVLRSTSHGLHLENPTGFAMVLGDFLSEVGIGDGIRATSIVG